MDIFQSISKIATTAGLLASGLIIAMGGAVWLVDCFWVGHPAPDDWD